MTTPEPQSTAAEAIESLSSEGGQSKEREVKDAEGDEKQTQDLPPLRMHVANRLSASGRDLLVPPATATPSAPPATGSTPRMKRRTSLERKKSRSQSPSIRAGTTTTTVASTTDGNSSLSSLEDLVVVDNDILTDKMGLEELNLEKQHSNSQLLHVSASSLPPVNERLSDETLEDSHAFSDVKSGTHSRGTSSIATGGDIGSLLETLEENDDEEEDVGDEEGEKVILTNMENLTIHEHHDEDEGIQNEDGSSIGPVA